MKVAVIGGTGRMGRAIAKQLSRANEVIIGSRDPERAKEAARGVRRAEGMGYAGACLKAEAVILSIPYSALGEAASLSAELEGKLVVSVVNPLKMEGGLLRFSLRGGSAAEELAEMLPKSRLGTAFNNVSSIFFERDEVTPMDILVAADSRGTYAEVAKLVESIPNLRPLYAGPLSEAGIIERMTPLVLNLAKLNRTGSLATKFVSTRD
jgi:NADPH-dependent F420 reductase